MGWHLVSTTHESSDLGKVSLPDKRPLPNCEVRVTPVPPVEGAGEERDFSKGTNIVLGTQRNPR